MRKDNDMKKKLISTLLVFALVLCAVPVAFPTLSTKAFACVGDTPCGDPNCPDKNPGGGGGGGFGVADGESDDPAYGYHKRLFVWVHRTRDTEGVKADYVKMELTPVDEDQQEEYLRRFKDFTGWEEDETLRLYAPSSGFHNVQLLGHLAKFEAEHYYSGYSIVEVGLIDEKFNVPEGPVYYEHGAIETEDVSPFSLSLRLGEYRIMLPDEYYNQAFTFAAKPDGDGGWEIILKDLDGNNIEYSVIE